MRKRYGVLMLALCMGLVMGVLCHARAEADMMAEDACAMEPGGMATGGNALAPANLRLPSPCYLEGWVVNRSPERGLRTGIDRASVTVTLGGRSLCTVTDSSGYYRVSGTCEFPAIHPVVGRITVTAMHPDYETSRSQFLVKGLLRAVYNVTLLKRSVTTVILIRHAERGNDHLTTAGISRANELVHVAEKAGVTAIYRTNTNRGLQTVQPLATAIGIEPGIYEDIPGLVHAVLEHHRGGMVLVQGHSDTLAPIAQAFGGGDPGNACTVAGNEFDNLCLITVYGEGRARVVNLQYGNAT